MKVPWAWGSFHIRNVMICDDNQDQLTMIKNDFSYMLYFLFCSHLNNRRVVEVCNISIHHNVDVNVNF